MPEIEPSPHARTRPSRQAGGDTPAAGEWTTAWLMGWLEHLAVGVLLLDRSRRLRYANRAAAAILRGRGKLWLDDAGHLQLRPPRLAADLARLMAQPPGSGAERGARVLTLGETGAAAPLTIVVAGSDGADGTITLMLIDGQPAVSTEALARLYGLTPAEAAVLGKLVRGQSASEIASCHGVSISTVRSQLKTLLSKTGTRRQAALVGKVAADSCALLMLPR